ncbi:ribonuclease H-like domain-containing protein [Paraliomyxa miuraensis]|uniref:ribonuclease H-like domain-containing protein n=1 Tax=Paraliomyxa miuraensis TaxID=376150 RepID=UPI00225B6F0F|nr:ribonuclease H-like domain-containing protein [Paraliomyxa miuraensis]MCX4247246.1 ribonuclease H-like domain-containing protein [Paraliomyxa miuraensis]
MDSQSDAHREHPLIPELSDLDGRGAGLFTAFAVLRLVRKGQTRAGKPYLDVRLADRSRTVAAKVWSDSGRAMQTAEQLELGTHVKVLFEIDSFKGALQLNVKGLRRATIGEPGYDPEALVDEGHALVEGLLVDTLVFDIETVPAVELRKVPPTVAQAVTKYADRQDWDEGKVMSLSPYFGKVISLAIGDGEAAVDEQKQTVFVVTPDDVPVRGELPEWVRPVTEQELLQAFWALAGHASVVVTYNGRNFDVPFLIGRSLIHDIPVRVDLQGNPFSLRPHLDLYLAMGGRNGRGPASLDVVCWAFGMPSPKEVMDGSMVATSYARGDVRKIAEYNAGDVKATTAVYQRVRDGLLRYRDDW